MAKVKYTKIEQFLIDNVMNIGNVPIFELEQTTQLIEKSEEYGREIIGIYIESSRSRITDNTVYELLLAFSYDSTLHGDWVWIDTKNLKVLE